MGAEEQGVLHCYSAYGLGISSQIPLPQLPEGAASVDVTVRCADLRPWPQEQGASFFRLRVEPNDICYALANIGAFRVLDAREIIVDAHPEVDAPALSLSVIGPCLALLLEQRGRLVLHASAACVGGQGVAFVGSHGWGKSTMVAALARRGHTFISDDVLALDLEAERPLMTPSFPLIKLWPDSATSLGCDPELLPRLRAHIPKVGLRLDEGVAAHAVPLQRLYILAGGHEVSEEAVPAREALPLVLAHWYGARFGGPMTQAAPMAGAFRRLAHLLNQVEVRMIRRPPDFSRLDACVDLVERSASGAG